MTAKIYLSNLKRELSHPLGWLLNPVVLVIVAAITIAQIWHPAIYALYVAAGMICVTIAIAWHRAPK